MLYGLSGVRFDLLSYLVPTGMTAHNKNMLNKKSSKAGFGRFQLLVLILAIAMGVILIIPFYNSYVACMENESCKPSGSACQKGSVADPDDNNSKDI